MMDVPTTFVYDDGVDKPELLEGADHDSPHRWREGKRFEYLPGRKGTVVDVDETGNWILLQSDENILGQHRLIACRVDGQHTKELYH